MARKVFLSFLGATNYTACNYVYEGYRKENIRFVQQATVEHFCKDWNVDDMIIIFTTPTAKERNWEDYYEFKKPCTNDIIKDWGLNTCLKNLKVNPQIKAVDIPEETSESKIWEMFQIVYEQLEYDDEIVFDITHGFRSSPMLLMVLINYAKFLKNITVQKILYGAFEATKSIDKPIWDLTNFGLLQEWTSGANEFINFGSADRLVKLTKGLSSKKSDIAEKKMFRNFEDLSKIVEEIALSIKTNRLNALVEGKIFETLKYQLSLLQIDLIKPYKPIIEKIEERTKDFSTEFDLKNGFVAVKWCIDNKLIQQGITLLQENILSYILKELDKDWRDKDLRRILSSCLSIKNKFEYNSNSVTWDKEFVDKFFDNPIILSFKKVYQKLNKSFRNDINHAGMNDNPINETKFEKALIEAYNDVIKIISNPPASV